MRNKLSAIIRNCPVCGSDEYINSYCHRFEPIDGASLLEEFLIVVCKDCGMAYANQIPNQDEIDSYYRRFSKYETADDNETISEHLIGLADFIYKELDCKQSNIVDVGCGGGILLGELRKRGYMSLTGVELSEKNCAKIRSSGINAINKSLLDLNSEDFAEAPDCIILSAVLEHISDLRLAVRTIAGLIKSGGILIISVPQLEHFTASAEFPFEEISLEHINYFSLDSLELLMRLHGLKLKGYNELKYGSSAVLNAIFHKPVFEENYMEKYISSCSELLAPTVQVIESYFQSQKPVVIYGAGTLCTYLLANTNLPKCNILQIIDGNKHYHGHTLGAYHICAPSALYDSALKDADIITVSYRYNDEITRIIRNMGLKNVIINLPVVTNSKS